MTGDEQRARGPEGPMLWPVLGGLRFFLAFIVAGAHLTWFAATFPVFLLERFSGLVAVFGFLVISGFSIAASYSKAPKGFYARRVLRIVPLYMLLVIASALVPCLFGGSIDLPKSTLTPPSATILIGNLLFMQGFLVEKVSTNPIVWTLSVEVLFYVLTPWVSRLSQLALLVIVCVLAAVYAGFHFFSSTYYSVLLWGGAVPLLGW